MDEKKLNNIKDDELDEVAGGGMNYDYYGNPINPVNPVPNSVPVTPINPSLNCSITNDLGATYVCQRCGGSKFRIKSANMSTITLKCRNCGTEMVITNA